MKRAEIANICRLLSLLLLILPLLSHGADRQPFKIETMAKGLAHPWAFAFLPDGRILVTERPGRLRIIENGRLHPRAIEGLPPITAVGQGGLLDIALHPNYKNNGWIYLSYAEPSKGSLFEKSSTAVARVRLQGHRLVDLQHLFSMGGKSRSGRHFGSRLLFDRAGYLYVTLGERGDRPRAQDLNDHAGSIIRLHDDGTIPKDNPFYGNPKAKAEIYSYGHRNPQGITLHPKNGDIWAHEHGPQGGDEINLIQAGRNYGWPIITYGVNYVIGTQVGEGTHKAGMEQPLYQWTPSIAPSGMAFYTGDKFKAWRGDLFVGSLKFQLLVRLELDGSKIVKEERLLQGQLGRIRDVRNGPDGYLYLLTDAADGRLVRLIPDESF